MHDYAGFTLASGDVDGNGSSDLLISAAYDSDAASYAGQTYLILAPAAPAVPALPGWGLGVMTLALLAVARRRREDRDSTRLGAHLPAGLLAGVAGSAARVTASGDLGGASLALLPACSSAVIAHRAHALAGTLAFFDLLLEPLPDSLLGLLLRLSLGVLHLLSLFGDLEAQLLLGSGSNALSRSGGISRRLGCVLLTLNLCAGSLSRLSG